MTTTYHETFWPGGDVRVTVPELMENAAGPVYIYGHRNGHKDRIVLKRHMNPNTWSR